MFDNQLHSHDARAAHFKHAEKNYMRMYRIFMGWRLLCALIAHSKKEKEDVELIKEVHLFKNLPALPTSAMTTEVERHFGTEIAVGRGVESLNNQVALCAGLIQENKKQKIFKEQLGAEAKTFFSGCTRIGVPANYPETEVQGQSVHRQLSTHNLVLMQTVLRRIEFFKGMVESSVSWADCREKTKAEFPGEMREQDVERTTFVPRKGLSVPERAHFGTTVLLSKRIASIDHRLHSMVNTVLKRKFPNWLVR